MERPVPSVAIEEPIHLALAVIIFFMAVTTAASRGRFGEVGIVVIMSSGVFTEDQIYQASNRESRRDIVDAIGTGASLDFAIAPAYYQTNWFLALCMAAFLALFWALHRFRVRQLRREERKLRDVVETIPSIAWTANEYAVSIRTDLAADLPKITADRVQLQQVLMNLMLNELV